MNIIIFFLTGHESGPIIINYLQFFYQVIKTALKERKFAIDKVIRAKINDIELFGRLLTRLDYMDPSVDQEIINVTLRIVKLLATKERIQELCKFHNFRFYDLVQQYVQFDNGIAKVKNELNFKYYTFNENKSLFDICNEIFTFSINLIRIISIPYNTYKIGCKQA